MNRIVSILSSPRYRFATHDEKICVAHYDKKTVAPMMTVCPPMKNNISALQFCIKRFAPMMKNDGLPPLLKMSLPSHFENFSPPHDEERWGIIFFQNGRHHYFLSWGGIAPHDKDICSYNLKRHLYPPCCKTTVCPPMIKVLPPIFEKKVFPP